MSTPRYLIPNEALHRTIGNSSCFLGNETKKAVGKLRVEPVTDAVGDAAHHMSLM